VLALAEAADELELALSWGAPNGLEFGASATALHDLLAWIDAAAAAGVETLRIVVAGPSLRAHAAEAGTLERTAAALAPACEAAARAGVVLAIENHGDLRAEQLQELLELVGDERLGVCFDTANALRVGDDVLEAATLLASSTRMVHLKDVEAVTDATDLVGGPRSVRYGEGVVPLEGVLAVLEDVGYRDLVCVEIAQLGAGDDEHALVADGVDWLRARAAKP
jgi:sugar phosphate isomerase/epimerase